MEKEERDSRRVTAREEEAGMERKGRRKEGKRVNPIEKGHKKERMER